MIQKLSHLLSHMRGTHILLALLVLLSIFLRTYKLSENMAFTFDQGRDMLVLKDMLKGDIKLVGPTTGIEGIFVGPFYYYFLLPGFMLFNGDPIGVALWQILWLSLVFIFAFYLLKPIVGKKFALFAIALLVFCAGSIDEARVIWNPSLALLVLIPSIFFLFQSRQKNMYLVFSTFLLGLTLHTEFAYAVFLMPLYAAWIGWFLLPISITKQKKQLYDLKIVLLAAFTFGITLVPQILFELKHDFLMTKTVIHEIQDSSKKVPLTYIWEHRPTEIAYTLEQRLFGLSKGSQFFFVCLILGFLWRVTKYKTTAEEKFLLAGFVLPILGLMFHTGNYGNFFFYYLNPHYFFGIVAIMLILSKIQYAPGKKAAIAFTCFVFFWSFLRTASVIYDDQLLQYSIEKEKQALLQVNNFNTPVGIEIFVPNLRPEQYQYLFYWLNKTNKISNATISVENQPYILLISEPPYGGDGSTVAHAEWVKRVHKHGNCNDYKQIGIIKIELCVRPQLQ